MSSTSSPPRKSSTSTSSTSTSTSTSTPLDRSDSISGCSRRINPHIHVTSPPLDDNSRKAIDTLRISLQSTCPYSSSLYARCYCTDLVLFQFLRARSFDQKKSLALLVANLEWREKVRPDEITAADAEIEAKTGKMTVDEFDRFGRPIWIMDNRRQGKFRSHESAMKHLLFHLERTKLVMNRSNQQRRNSSSSASSSSSPSASPPIIRDIGSVEKYCLFIHLAGYSVWNSPPLKTSMETLKCLTDRYVEHLGTTIVYQAPAYFNVLWSACKPFLDKQTVAKIIFINGDVSDGSANDRILRDVIGDNWRQLCDVPVPSDPLARREYHHEQVWPRMKIEQEAWWALLKKEREEKERKENGEETEKKVESAGQQPTVEEPTDTGSLGHVNENAEGTRIAVPAAHTNAKSAVPIPAAS